MSARASRAGAWARARTAAMAASLRVTIANLMVPTPPSWMRRGVRGGPRRSESPRPSGPSIGLLGHAHNEKPFLWGVFFKLMTKSNAAHAPEVLHLGRGRGVGGDGSG